MEGRGGVRLHDRSEILVESKTLHYKNDNQQARRRELRVLRAAACKNRELHFSDPLVEFLIFCLKVPLD